MAKSIFALLTIALLISGLGAVPRTQLKQKAEKSYRSEVDENCTLYQILLGVSLAFNLGSTVDALLSHMTISEQDKKLQEQETQIKELNRSVMVLLADNKQLKDQNADLQQLNGELQGLVTELRTENEKMATELDELADYVEELENQVFERDAQIKELQLKVKKQDAAITYLSASNTLYAKVVDLQEAEISEKNYEIVAMKADNLILKETIQLQDAEIDHLRGTVKDQELTIKAQDVSIVTFKTEKILLRGVVDLQKESIREKNIVIAKQINTISARNAAVTILKLAIDIQADEIERQNHLINSQNEEIKSLKLKLEEQEQQIDILKSAIEQLHVQIAKFDEEHKECQLAWIKASILEEIHGKSVTFTKKYEFPTNKCSTRDFHNACKTVKPSFFVATEQGTGVKFGGFTTQAFDGREEFKSDPHAFTFSLSTLKRCTIKKDRVDYAIYAGEHYGLLSDYTFLAYGNWELSIIDDCGKYQSELIANSAYTCPENGKPYFYASQRKPKLSALEFYQVDGLFQDLNTIP